MPAIAADAETEIAADDLPDTLDGFRSWLSTASLPFPTSGARLAPAGDPGAALMVMTDMPAPSGGWFEGEAGPLFDRMLAAMNGLGRDKIYLAPLRRRDRSRGGSIRATRRLGEIARHHVGLVRPRALLLFGDACATALLDAPVAETRGRWHEIETPTGPVRAVATIRPEQIGGRAPIRKMVWEDLQRVMEERNR